MQVNNSPTEAVQSPCVVAHAILGGNAAGLFKRANLAGSVAERARQLQAA